MAEYIDRAEIVREFTSANAQADFRQMMGTEVYSQILAIVNSAPAADVVPVVRCKDCKYSSDFDDSVYLCNLRMIGLVRSESFCSFGVREE